MSWQSFSRSVMPESSSSALTLTGSGVGVGSGVGSGVDVTSASGSGSVTPGAAPQAESARANISAQQTAAFLKIFIFRFDPLACRW